MWSLAPFVSFVLPFFIPALLPRWRPLLVGGAVGLLLLRWGWSKIAVDAEPGVTADQALVGFAAFSFLTGLLIRAVTLTKVRVSRLIWIADPLLLLVLAASASNFWVSANAAGVCWAERRTLSEEVKRERYLHQLNSSFPPRKPDGPRNHTIDWYIIQEAKAQLGYEIDTSLPYEFTGLADAGASVVKIHLYPDVPDYALSHYSHDKGRYSTHKYGVAYDVVPDRYKLTGYAYDLMLADLTLRFVKADGQQVQLRIDRRDWTDACGNIVELPDEFHTG